MEKLIIHIISKMDATIIGVIQDGCQFKMAATNDIILDGCQFKRAATNDAIQYGYEFKMIAYNDIIQDGYCRRGETKTEMSSKLARW